MSRYHVLMCGSRLDVKGGMVSVIKNYLGHEDWADANVVYVPTHVEKHKLVTALYFGAAYVKILCLLPKYKFKVAHLHTAERGSFFRKAILLRTLRAFGVKVILHHHAAEFEEFYAGLSEKMKAFAAKTLELADCNIVLSRQLVSMITEKAPKARVEVLYNSVSTFPENPYNPDGENVLFLGRLGHRKGTYDLLHAIYDIDNRVPKNVKFYLCGDGEVEQVRQQVKEMGIGHRIAHIGWINKEQKQEILPNTCLNVLPSYNEGLPMTILETMAYGIPNISTAIASIPEVVIDGETGCLIQPGDVDALAEAMAKLLADPQQRSSMSKNCYELIDKSFRLDNNIKQLLTIYRSLLN